MALKKTQVARDVRVKFAPHYVPSSLNNYYMATQELFLFIREPHVYNDSYGEYVMIAGGTGMTSGSAYLKNLELEFSTEDNKGGYDITLQLLQAQEALRLHALKRIHNLLRDTFKLDSVVLTEDPHEAALTGMCYTEEGDLAYVAGEGMLYPAVDMEFHTLILMLNRLEKKVESRDATPFPWTNAPVYHRIYFKDEKSDRYLLALNVPPQACTHTAFDKLGDAIYVTHDQLPEYVQQKFDLEKLPGFHYLDDQQGREYTVYPKEKVNA